MTTEFKRYQRNLTTARRELRRAVERAGGVDMRKGHRAEAARRAREVHRAADELVKRLEA